jgi:predicted Na+-dependent transporter
MGTLGFLKPAAVAWLKGELVTFSLALTMLFMGMTLTVQNFPESCVLWLSI